MRLCGAVMLVFVICSWLACADCEAEECSTAVISGAASVDGRPILWKNRDTEHLSNKVVFVDETPYSYLGIVDADDASGRRVYVGLNAAGFAIMNTVAYNLPRKAEEAEDLEGTIMADALRLCRTAEDFETYIKENRGRALGSQANFGVIDAAGGAAVFEVHNNGFERLDAGSVPEKYILVTNYSRSGEADKGRGYVRFDRLAELFRADEDGKYSLAQILQNFARDLQNPYLPRLESAKRAKLPADKPYFLHTQQTIDRGSTAAAVVIRGVESGGEPRDAALWVILGEPVCGIAVPLWVEAGEAPPELGGRKAEAGEAPSEPAGGDAAPINLESMRLKSILRPFKDDERAEYADLAKLENKAGTGWLPVLAKKEQEIIERTSAFLAANPDRSAKAQFQKQIAAEVLETLKGIK